LVDSRDIKTSPGTGATLPFGEWSKIFAKNGKFFGEEEFGLLIPKGWPRGNLFQFISSVFPTGFTGGGGIRISVSIEVPVALIYMSNTAVFKFRIQGYFYFILRGAR